MDAYLIYKGAPNAQWAESTKKIHFRYSGISYFLNHLSNIDTLEG